MALVDALKQSERLRPHLETELELCCADRPGPALLAQLETVERCLIIDAVLCNGKVGQLHRWSDVSEVERCNPICSTHGLGLAQTLAMGKQLGVLPRQLQILGVEIDPAERGTSLSKRIKAEFPLLLDQITDEIVASLGAG
jgi:hydrogenase maturation protease